MMTAGVLAEKLVQRALAPFGYSIRKVTQQRSYDDGVPLSEDAAAWLRRDNPALIELHKRYAATGLPVAVPSTWWSQRRLRNNVQLGYFRGDNAYVYGYRKDDEQATRMRFLLLARHIAQHDPRGLLQRLEEDGAFGCWSYKFEALPRVSRDLLDSISEIYFLDRRFDLFRSLRHAHSGHRRGLWPARASHGDRGAYREPLLLHGRNSGFDVPL